MVAVNALLQLQPAEYEAECWQSASAVRLLRTVDVLSLVNAVCISAALVRGFAEGMSLSQLAHAAVYGLLAAMQLAVLAWKPDIYQRHRFKARHSVSLPEQRTILCAAASITVVTYCARC